LHASILNLLTPTSLDDTIIAVHVGTDTPSKPFFIQECTLRQNSSLLNNALKPEWHKDDTNQLSECDRDAFSTYAQWLFNGRVAMISPPDESVGAASNANEYDDDEWFRWADHYVLANYLQDSDFADALVDVAIEFIGATSHVSLLITPIIYKYSRKDSSYRRFALRAIGCGAEFELLLEGITWDGLSNEFLVDLQDIADEDSEGTALMMAAGELNRCLYRDHKGAECYRVKRGWMYV
jgi:hypothetical protein